MIATAQEILKQKIEDPERKKEELSSWVRTFDLFAIERILKDSHYTKFYDSEFLTSLVPVLLQGLIEKWRVTQNEVSVEQRMLLGYRHPVGKQRFMYDPTRKRTGVAVKFFYNPPFTKDELTQAIREGAVTRDAAYQFLARRTDEVLGLLLSHGARLKPNQIIVLKDGETGRQQKVTILHFLVMARLTDRARQVVAQNKFDPMRAIQIKEKGQKKWRAGDHAIQLAERLQLYPLMRGWQMAIRNAERSLFR